MDSIRFASPVIRLLRLQKNWSQETLCHGICAVSYLSKIEQGRVCISYDVRAALYDKLLLSFAELSNMLKFMQRSGHHGKTNTLVKELFFVDAGKHPWFCR